MNTFFKLLILAIAISIFCISFASYPTSKPDLVSSHVFYLATKFHKPVYI